MSSILELGWKDSSRNLTILKLVWYFLIGFICYGVGRHVAVKELLNGLLRKEIICTHK